MGERGVAAGAVDASEQPAMRFEHVSFSYEGHVALDDVSFQVMPGELVALSGPNGCGKSTVMRLASGLDFASAGTVAVLGQRVDATTMSDLRTAKRLHQRAGLVFQNPDSQLFCPSVYEEVAFGPRQMGLGEDEVARRVTDTLALFGLAGFEERSPWRLSGGEKRRVALAAIVSMGPELLMLDELVDGLDVESLGRVADFIESYVAAGGTVLMTTHHHDHVRLPEARHVVMDAHHRIA